MTGVVVEDDDDDEEEEGDDEETGGDDDEELVRGDLTSGVRGSKFGWQSGGGTVDSSGSSSDSDGNSSDSGKDDDDRTADDGEEAGYTISGHGDSWGGRHSSTSARGGRPLPGHRSSVPLASRTPPSDSRTRGSAANSDSGRRPADRVLSSGRCLGPFLVACMCS